MSEKLRPYQLKIVNKALETVKHENSAVLVQMPTGTGKTHVFAEIVRKWTNYYEPNKKVLILAHRKELIDQIIDRLKRFGIKGSPIVSGKVADINYRVQVAMIQSLKKKERLPKNISLIIIDEAHHTPANTYISLITHYLKENPKVKIIGLTATPWRLSGAGFSDIFDHLIQSESIKWFIQKGFLAKIKHFAASMLDLKNVKVDNVKKEYDEKELENYVRNEVVLAELIESYKKLAFGKKAIVFALNRAHSADIVKRYNDAGISAEFIDAQTDKELRDSLVKKFRNGEINILCNVNIFTEGFDCPDVEVVQLARPTKSLSLYLQQVGRVMRPTSGKEYGIVIDNACLWEEHGMITQPFSWSLNYSLLEEDKSSDDRKKRLVTKKASLPKELSGIDLMELLDDHNDSAYNLNESNEIFTNIKNEGTVSHGQFDYYLLDDDNETYGEIRHENKFLLENVLISSIDEIDDIFSYELEDIGIIPKNELLLVSKNGLYGLENRIDNKLILDCKYDEIFPPNLFGFSIISQNQKYGVFNLVTNKICIPADYDEILHTNSTANKDFFIAKKGEKYGIISSLNYSITSMKFSEIVVIEDVFNVKINDDWKILDSDFSFVAFHEYKVIQNIGDYQVISCKENLSLGLHGNVLMPFQFKKVNPCGTNLIIVHYKISGYFGERMGLLDYNLNWVLPPIYFDIENIDSYIVAHGYEKSLLDQFGNVIIKEGFEQILISNSTPVIKTKDGWSILIDNQIKFTSSKKTEALQKFKKSKKKILSTEKKIKQLEVIKKEQEQNDFVKKTLRQIFDEKRVLNNDNGEIKRINALAFELQLTVPKLNNILTLAEIGEFEINRTKLSLSDVAFFKESIEFLNAQHVKF